MGPLDVKTEYIHTMGERIMPSGRYDVPARSCDICGLTYKPKGARSKYCTPCKVEKKRAYSRQWYLDNLDRARANSRSWYWRNRERALAKSREWYDKYERFNSEIVGREDWAREIRARIAKRRGDTVVVRPLVRSVFEKLGIELSSYSGELRKCYAWVENLLEEMGAEHIGRTAHSGKRYQFKREKE